MGEVIHRATIVTSFDASAASAALTLARVLFEATMITPILVSPVNSYRSFAILTCGSKSGWAEKTEDDAAREAFTAWVEHQSYEDGSNALECVTVEYGRDLRGLELKQDEPGGGE